MQKETGSILVHGPTVQTMGDCIGSGNKSVLLICSSGKTGSLKC